jgi:hypothetical protein
MRNVEIRDSNFSSAIFILGGQMGSRLNVFNGIFIHVSGLLASQSQSSTVRIVDSVFADSAIELGKTDFFTRRCTVGTNLNLTLIGRTAMNTDYCWLGQATWDVTNISFQMSGASIVFVLICVTIFATYCFMKGKLADPGGMNKELDDRRKTSDWSDREDIEEIVPEPEEGVELSVLADPQEPGQQKDGDAERGGHHKGRGRGGRKKDKTFQ